MHKKKPMSKELEALKSIEDWFVDYLIYHNIKHKECPDPTIYVRKNCGIEIIETALKKQEQDQKKVKALEIIKRSPVMIICEIYKCAIELKMSYKEYCDYFSKDEQSIKSKEEYDLLKEVLLCKAI